jgi:formylglycine-generating enzyme required for sulfatase activity
VLVEGAKVPEPTQVPPTLVPLLRRQVTKVDSGADFHFHIRRLIDSIRKIRAALRKDVLQEIWTPPGMPEHTELITIVPSTSIVEYADPRDSHGDYVGTRGRHTLWLPSRYRLGMHLVTNAFFREFVADRGYESDAYWPNGGNRHPPVGAPGALDHHPVAGVCFFEAMAFVNWLRDKHPTPNWSWQLPTEDAWEFAARAEDGRNYPWGTTWSANCCNSRDAGLNGTSDVSRYPAGRGPFGHFDLAGNLWEPVQTSDQSSELCTLRGGSFTNTSAEVRAHLRLHHVRKSLGARDFGFRVAQAFDPRS